MAMQIQTISVTNTILYDEEIKENMFLCKYFMQFHEKKLYICCRLQMILNLHVIIPFYKQLIKTHSCFVAEKISWGNIYPMDLKWAGEIHVYEISEQINALNTDRCE